MRKIISLSIENPVLVNILMVMIIIIGLFSFLNMPRELVSEVKFNWAMIIIPYPGASSEEVEQLVVIPIEDEIQDVQDIDEIMSSSTEGSGFLMVKFRTISDELFRIRTLDIKAEMDRIPNLPENTREDMIITELDTTEMVPVVTLHLSGSLTELEMRRLSTDLRRKILQIDGVAKAELAGVNERQVWIELDPDLLEAHNVTPDIVSQALAMANRNVPAGKVRAGREELLLRTIGRFKDAERIKKVVVRSMPGGNALSVDDLAKVTDGFEERRTFSHLDGKRSVSINITKRSNSSTIDIIKKTRELVADIQPTLPAGAWLKMTGDTSVQINETLNILRNNAVLGMILIMIFLYLAIGARNAFFVALGIPVTFLATFIFMYYTGNSINGNSLFGLILVIGVVVDDAIIIIENCYRHYQMGKDLQQAAIDGASEVAVPVVSATLTTLAAFMPLMLMPGIIGKFMRIVPIVVTLVLAASMVEAFIILPSHFNEWTSKKSKPQKTPEWLQRLQAAYTTVLQVLLKKRGWMMLGLILMLVIAGLIIPIVGVELTGDEEINMFQVFFELPTGTSLEITNDTLEKIERLALKLPSDEVLSIQGTSGLMRTQTDWVFANNVGEVLVELVPKKQGRRNLDDIINEMRADMTRIPGISKISFLKPHSGPPTGQPVDIRILGRDFDQLVKITKQLKEHLSDIEGVVDIQDSWKSSKKEVRVIVDESAAAYYGLDLAKVAMFVRTAFEGQVSTTYRDGNDEVEVLVRYPRHFEKDMNTIQRLRVPGVNATGKIVWVPFSSIASLKIIDAWPEIDRLNQERYISLTADITAEHSNELVEINKGIVDHWDKNLSKRFPGYHLDFGGEFKEFEESFASLKMLFLVGIFLVYVILGGQFKSFVQPIIILFTIPFAFIGSMLGLLVAGSSFSIVVMYGIVALAGVAVNDAIVMIDFVNKAREKGIDKLQSLLQAGQLRLRPILLTTITTVGGLLPTALGLGGRSESWAPLANVIVFGMLGSTLMTLFIIPCVYRIFIDDIPRKLKRLRRKYSKNEVQTPGIYEAKHENNPGLD